MVVPGSFFANVASPSAVPVQSKRQQAWLRVYLPIVERILLVGHGMAMTMTMTLWQGSAVDPLKWVKF